MTSKCDAMAPSYQQYENNNQNLLPYLPNGYANDLYNSMFNANKFNRNADPKDAVSPQTPPTQLSTQPESIANLTKLQIDASNATSISSAVPMDSGDGSRYDELQHLVQQLYMAQAQVYIKI